MSELDKVMKRFDKLDKRIEGLEQLKPKDPLKQTDPLLEEIQKIREKLDGMTHEEKHTPLTCPECETKICKGCGEEMEEEETDGDEE